MGHVTHKEQAIGQLLTRISHLFGKLAHVDPATCTENLDYVEQVINSVCKRYRYLQGKLLGHFLSLEAELGLVADAVTWRCAGMDAVYDLIHFPLMKRCRAEITFELAETLLPNAEIAKKIGELGTEREWKHEAQTT